MARPIQDCVVLLVGVQPQTSRSTEQLQGDSITSRQDVPQSLQALMGGMSGAEPQRGPLTISDVYRRTLDILNRGYGGFNTTLQAI
jgi:hypothetical protein